MPFEALKSFLSSQPPGPLAEEEQFETLLVSAWDELDGSADGGMESYKLKGRMERLGHRAHSDLRKDLRLLTRATAPAG
jgi:hypothetical protein